MSGISSFMHWIFPSRSPQVTEEEPGSSFNKEGWQISCRLALWISGVVAAYFLEKRTTFVPYRSAPTLALLGLADTLPRITRLANQAVSSISVARKAGQFEQVQRAFEKRAQTYPLFPILRIEPLPEQEYTVNTSKVPFTIKVAAGKAGVIIEGGDPLALVEILAMVQYQYPHLSWLEIQKYPDDGAPLVLVLRTFQKLERLSFKHCKKLNDQTVRRIIDGSAILKRIDLVGCTALTEAYCKVLAERFALTFPDGSSNLKELYSRFHHDLREICNQALLRILSDRRRSNAQASAASSPEPSPVPQLSDMGELEALIRSPKPMERDEQKRKSDRIKELLIRLSPLFSPIHLDPELASQIRSMLDKPYAVILNTPFALNFHGFFMCDALLEPVLTLFQHIRAHPTTIDISDTLVAGYSLRAGQGLPVQEMKACRLNKLDNQALGALKAFPELLHLDLCESSLDDEGLTWAIFSLPKIVTLNLKGCKGISAAGLRKAIPPLMKTLELLCIEDLEIRRSCIEFLVTRGGENTTKPFIVVSTSRKGMRCVDFSRLNIIDPSTIEHLKHLGSDKPIQILVFEAHSHLTIPEVSKLTALPNMLVESLDLVESIIEPADLTFLISRWPLKLIRLSKMDIKLTGLRSIQTIEIDKLEIESRHRIDLLLPFLEGFEQIGTLSLRKCHFGSTEEELSACYAAIASFCAEKNVTTLDLSFTHLRNNHLELVPGEPNDPSKQLLNTCDEIILSGNKVADPFRRWKCDLDPEHQCVVITNDKSITFNSQE